MHLTAGATRRRGSPIRLVVLTVLLAAVVTAVWIQKAGNRSADPAASMPPAQGAWYPRSEDAEALDGEELARLMSLPYLSAGSRASGDATGVTVLDEERAFPGVNLYVSAHAPEAYLMDMRGRPLHRWSLEFDRAFPDQEPNDESAFWRRVHALPDGGLLAIFQGFGMLRLDRESRLLWTSRVPVYNHITVTPDGKIYTVTKEAGVLPAIQPDEPVVQDFVAILDSNGRLLSRISILEALERSDHSDLLADLPRSGELFHTNSVRPLEKDLTGMPPAFRRGNILVSVRELDLVAVIDPEAARIVWAAQAGWIRQHEPTMVGDGRILLFDNRGWRRKSRVLEFDPRALEISWQWPGEAAGTLYSYQAGSCARLPNGNTLITESERGRALEITRDGELVWEFNSPHRAGPEGRYVAALWEMVRLERDYFDVRFAT